MARDIDLIWVRRKQEYFFKQDWTAQIRLIRFNKSAFWSRSPPGYYLAFAKLGAGGKASMR
jgi:hypothetical protein